MTVEKTELMEMALELGTAAEGVGNNFSVLEDIKENFLQLVEKMNDIEQPENLETSFTEWGRELRILSQLMHHSIEGFRDHKDDVRYLSEGIAEIAKEGETNENL